MAHNFKLPTSFDSGEISLKDVDKRAKDSAAMIEYWDTVDAISGGIKTMRAAGNLYLPKFPSEETKEFDFRLKQTKMTNIYSDIVDGLASKPFEEKITIDSTEHDNFINNVDGRGNDLTQFAAITFYNGRNSTIDWIFIDYPKSDKSIKNRADQKAAGLRPFWSRVIARNMLEAKTEIINGSIVLTLVRILEPGKTTKIRKFQRDVNGDISWFLYAKNDKDDWIIEDEGILTIDVIPLVPFITGKRDGENFQFKPALQGAVDLQLDLYEQESALKYAKVCAAFPMLAGNGVKPEMSTDGSTVKRLSTGPAKVLYAPMDGSGKAGSWSYVEPSASSLVFLAADIKDTKQDLRELGKQPLTAQSGNLTVITTSVAANKSKSAVVSWAISLANTLENAFEITNMWLNKSTPVKVSVYTEFDGFIDGDDGLDKLIDMNEKGQLSTKTLHHETKRRRYLSSDFDHDREMALILNELPE